jgi:hypothetical protein
MGCVTNQKARIALALTWIMWLNIGPEFWEQQSDYETKDNCVEALRNIELKHKGSGSLGFLNDVNNGVLTVQLNLPNGKTQINQWRCLPNIIDPRSPTAK